jgi:hypothetical protein
MVQAVDGNWYGYFGDSTAVVAADRATNNLDFGIDADPTRLTGDFSEAESVYSDTGIANQGDGVVKNGKTISWWNA